MITDAGIKFLGAFAIALGLFYMFSVRSRGVVTENATGSKKCSPALRNIAVTQQGELDVLNQNYRIMKAEMEEFKKTLKNQEAEILLNEKRLKDLTNDTNKELKKSPINN